MTIPSLTYWWVGRPGQSLRSPLIAASAPTPVAMSLVFLAMLIGEADNRPSSVALVPGRNFTTYIRIG